MLVGTKDIVVERRAARCWHHGSRLTGTVAYLTEANAVHSEGGNGRSPATQKATGSGDPFLSNYRKSQITTWFVVNGVLLRWTREAVMSQVWAP